MRTLKNRKIFPAIMLLALAACGAQIEEDGTGGNSNSSTGVPVGSLSSVRYCTDNEITASSQSKLSGFFSTIVSGLEGAPTFCHEFNGVGNNVDANLMIEYEDRYGIRSVKFTSESVIASQVNTVNNEIIAEAIFRDGYGLVKIIARGPESTGVLSGQIRYYNFPSFEEALNDAIEAIREECQSGEKSVFECLGYTYPTHWWNQPVHTTEGQQMLEMAKEFMRTGSGKYTVLGAIELDIGQTTWPF